MLIEIEDKDYSASISIIGNEIIVDYVLVTVAGVTFDIVNLMPPEVWSALYKEIEKRFLAEGGMEEELRAKKLKLSEGQNV